MRVRATTTSSEPPGDGGGLTASANSSDSITVSCLRTRSQSTPQGRRRRLSWKDLRPLAPPVKENAHGRDGAGGSPSSGSGSTRRATESGETHCGADAGARASANLECGSPTFGHDGDWLAPSDIERTSSSGFETCRPLLHLSGEMIDDRRSSPSKADHGFIINSFQQGLASVETVIVYDNDSVHSDTENEHSLSQGIWSWPISRFIVQLREACVGICSCHEGLVGVLSTLHLHGGRR